MIKNYKTKCELRYCIIKKTGELNETGTAEGQPFLIIHIVKAFKYCAKMAPNVPGAGDVFAVAIAEAKMWRSPRSDSDEAHTLCYMKRHGMPQQVKRIQDV